jgi:AraC-like DNA-binding protein
MNKKAGKPDYRPQEVKNITFYTKPVGLPSFMILEQSGKSGEDWGPVVRHRISEHCEVIYVIGGAGRIAIDDCWHDCKMHQVFFIPPGIPLDIITQEKNKLDLLYSHFHFKNDHRYTRLNGSFSYLLHEIDSLNKNVFSHLLALRDEIILPPENLVLSYLKAGLDVYEKKEPGFYQETCLLLLGAVHQISRMTITSLSQPLFANPGKTTALANQIRSHISNHIETYSGMGELEKAFNMNGTHLSRVFKLTYGENIILYVNRLRIELAKKYLTTTHVNIPDIIRRSGFTDESHFRRVFKSLVGITPTEFRNQRRLEPTEPIKFHTPFESALKKKL